MVGARRYPSSSYPVLRGSVAIWVATRALSWRGSIGPLPPDDVPPDVGEVVASLMG
jgi:hypothetical protein